MSTIKLPFLGLWDWRIKVRDGSKCMTRRAWSKKHSNWWYKKLVSSNGLVVAGNGAGIKKGGSRSSLLFAVLKVDVKRRLERLIDMSQSDVILEGGGVGETPRQFVERNHRYFVKLKKRRIGKRCKIDYNYEYHVITWTLLGWIPCHKFK